MAAAGAAVAFIVVAAARFADRWAAAWREDQPGVLQYAAHGVPAPLSVPVEVPRCADRPAPGPLSARPEVLQYADLWVAALQWVQAGVPRCADRRVPAPQWGRPAMLQCVGLPATSQSAVAPTCTAGHTRMFTVAPIPIMALALSRQVLSQAPLLVPQRRPHTIIHITRSPTTNLRVDRHTRRTRQTVPTPIEGETCMQSPCWLSALIAVCVLVSAAAQAQVSPFQGNGPGLSPEDNRLLFESAERLNAAEPSWVVSVLRCLLVRAREMEVADAFGAEAYSIRRSRLILLWLLTPGYKHKK